MNGIIKLIGPYFETWIHRLSSRVPFPKDRIGDLRTLRRKTEKHFTDALTYEDLDSRRKWTEFQKLEIKSLSEDWARIFTQDLNTVLHMMHADGKIKLIRLRPPKRRKSSSEGFHVEQLLHFTFADVRTLWKSIIIKGIDERALIFVLLVCTCCAVCDLLRLRVQGIGKRTITIYENGLIHSILLEPAKSLLLRYVLEQELNIGDKVFRSIADTGTFSRWLKQECREAGVPIITPDQLVYFARYVLVLNGVPPYVAAILGKKNAFSPLVEDCYEQLAEFLEKNRDRIWKS